MFTKRFQALISAAIKQAILKESPPLTNICAIWWNVNQQKSVDASATFILLATLSLNILKLFSLIPQETLKYRKHGTNFLVTRSKQ